MENNLIKIFKDTVISNHDNGNTINSLIKLNIIDIDDLIEEIIDTYNPEYIYNFAKYIDKMAAISWRDPALHFFM